MSGNKRLGLLIPSSDITIEIEFRKYLPDNIGLHVTRMPLGEVTTERLAKMAKESTESVRLIMDAEPHLIIYGCTSGSFLGGKGYDEKLESRLTSISGIPTITTAHAVVDALKSLGSDKLVICTPYIEKINQIEKKFFQDNGFSVLSIHGMNMIKDIEIGKIDSQCVYNFAVEHDEHEADTMFISCTNLKTLDIIPKLCKELGKSIVSSNLATLWAICKRLKIRDKPEVLERLQY